MATATAGDVIETLLHYGIDVAVGAANVADTLCVEAAAMAASAGAVVWGARAAVHIADVAALSAPAETVVARTAEATLSVVTRAAVSEEKAMAPVLADCCHVVLPAGVEAQAAEPRCVEKHVSAELDDVPK